MKCLTVVVTRPGKGSKMARKRKFKENPASGNWILVKFLEDSVLYGCPKCRLRSTMQSDVVEVKWVDGRYYQAELLYCGSKEEVEARKSEPLTGEGSIVQSSHNEEIISSKDMPTGLNEASQVEFEPQDGKDQTTASTEELSKNDSISDIHVALFNGVEESAKTDAINENDGIHKYSFAAVSEVEVEMALPVTNYMYSQNGNANECGRTGYLEQFSKTDTIADILSSLHVNEEMESPTGMCNTYTELLPMAGNEITCTGLQIQHSFASDVCPDPSDIDDPQYEPSSSEESEAFDDLVASKENDLEKTKKHRKKHKKTQKERKPDEQHGKTLSVETTKNSTEGRVWDKKQYCVFCENPYSKIARHLLAKHKNEPQVAEILNHKPGSSIRKKLLEELRNKGNFNRNISVMNSQDGVIVVNKRPASGDQESDGKKYLPCSHCYGFFKRGMLWRHVKVCKFRKEKQGKNIQHQTLGHCLLSTADIDFPAVRELLLSKMISDHVTLCVKNDALILALGNSILEKKGHIPQYYQYIIQKMRELGRLLLKIRENVQVDNLMDCITPVKFDTVVSAAKNVAGFNDKTHTYSTPSLALKIGHSLKKIASIVKCQALRSGNEKQLHDAECFLKLCEMEWTTLVSSNALETLKMAKMNKINALPVTEDIMLLQKHLTDVSETSQNILLENPSLSAWGNLCQASLAQLIMFNRKRGGEAQRITLDVYKNITNENVHSDIEKLLSPVEKQLCKMLCRVEIMGKRGRIVPVIITPKLKHAIDLLIEKRSVVEINPNNPYVFARANPYCLTCYRGCDCLRNFAESAALKHPETLTSTRLRKHVATVSQIMNLQEPELDQLASFMGHDLAVHRHFYRLPESTLQVVKVSKILLALDRGKLEDLKGKTIDEVDGNYFDDEDNTTSEQESEDDLDIPCEDIETERQKDIENKKNIESEQEAENDMDIPRKKRKKEKKKNIQNKKGRA